MVDCPCCLRLGSLICVRTKDPDGVVEFVAALCIADVDTGVDAMVTKASSTIGR